VAQEPARGLAVKLGRRREPAALNLLGYFIG